MKVGDIVARKSYNKDIVFKITDIIDQNGKKIAILKGVAFRIIADAELSDLELLKPPDIRNILMDKNVENILYRTLKKAKERERRGTRGLPKSAQQPTANVYGVPGKVLQIDGDKEYLKICLDVYSQLGIPAVGVAIPEANQYKEVKNLLEKHKPDILVITGHDGMIKRGTNYNDIYNYRNSSHFINTVKEARRYDLEKGKKTVIFAGACQSYFEAIITAGANFASSPARILIDFLDPLIVAEKVATTSEYKYITIDDIVKELRDGKKGIGGVGSNGKMKYAVT